MRIINHAAAVSVFCKIFVSSIVPRDVAQCQAICYLEHLLAPTESHLSFGDASVAFKYLNAARVVVVHWRHSRTVVFHKIPSFKPIVVIFSHQDIRSNLNEHASRLDSVVMNMKAVVFKAGQNRLSL